MSKNNPEFDSVTMEKVSQVTPTAACGDLAIISVARYEYSG